MKFTERSILIACVWALGLVMVSCSGSGGGGGSKLKTNDYLGNLPAIHDSHDLQEAAMEAKMEEQSQKLMAGGEKNYGKLETLFDEYQAKKKEAKAKFEADSKAELDKIVGKEIPVSFSEQLKNSDMLFFEASDVKMAADGKTPRIALKVLAKDSFTIPPMKSYDYMIYYRHLGENGTPIAGAASVIIPVEQNRQPVTFEKGFLISDSFLLVNVGRNPAEWAGFSGVEFISKEEYNAGK